MMKLSLRVRVGPTQWEDVVLLRLAGRKADGWMQPQHLLDDALEVGEAIQRVDGWSVGRERTKLYAEFLLDRGVQGECI
jgi:hypothetical protein